MKILFVRPPRYMWPLYSERSNFWQPLAFASIAAFLREHIDGLNLRIIDCPTEKIGWKSVEIRLKQEKPDVICVGEETVSSHEALGLAKLTKELFPECIVVAGGVYFSFMVEDSLLNHPINFIVRGEGEFTFYELVKELLKPKREQSFAKVKGISYKKDGKIVNNTDRGLIKNLDVLPMPAYDLLPMELYGKGSRYHTDFAAIEHSRGCIGSCNFCILWKQMGFSRGNDTVSCYRTKSPKKTFEEVMHLHEKYKRKTFCWTDATWDADPKWNSEFSDLMINSGIDTRHTIWSRADCIVRDKQSGVLDKEIKAGIRHFMVGLERTSNADLTYLEKKNSSFETTKKAFEILKEYPDVLSVATYIYGIPTETWGSMRDFYRLLDKIPFDVGLAVPLTPYPGTRYYEDYDHLIEIKDFSYYNLINPVMRSEEMSRTEITLAMIINEIRVRTGKEQLRKLMLGKEFRKRLAIGALAKTKAGFTLKYLVGMASEAVFNKPLNQTVRPEWYDG